MRSLLLPAAGFIAAFALPRGASAHEVYVLPPEVVAQMLSTPAFSLMQVISQNVAQFMLWTLIAAAVVCAVFFISTSKTLERLCDPWLAKLPPYAPAISRIAIGVSFLAGAYYLAIFGPELTLAGTFGSYASPAMSLLIAIGIMLTIGFYTRVAAAAGLALFGIATLVHGPYMLTYVSYLGELILLLILGAHTVAFHHRGHDARDLSASLLRLKERLTPYAFPILRISFGISLLYASLYAKVLHNNLALQVAYAHPGMVAFFGFEPHFLVLGAAILEIVIALFFILGVEIRFASLFVLFWLSLSLLYFGESVWPHVILVGIPLAFIFYGYDKYSLEGRFFKRGGKEPVL